MSKGGPVSRRKALKYSGGALVSSLTALAGCMGGGGDEGGGETTSDATSQSEQGGTDTAEPASGATEAETAVATAEPPSNEATTDAGNTAAQTIRLGGNVDGWQGRAPEAIQGTTNPPLSLQPGTSYRLTWENLDGAEHELIIEDANGNEIVASESSSQQGVTRSLTFTASEKMNQYYCEYHPQSMRGDIQNNSGTAMTSSDSVTTSN